MGGIFSEVFLRAFAAWTIACGMILCGGCCAPEQFVPANGREPSSKYAHAPHGTAFEPGVEQCRYVTPVNAQTSCSHRQPLFQEPIFSDGSQLTLDDALRIALQHSDIARTIDGDEVSTADATSYDAAIDQEAMQAALAEFDTNLETTFAWNRFEGPPNSFFGPGIDREDRRDEATLATGLTKKWYRGTQTRIAYNPAPGYLFFPNGSTGFNPSHVSALELEVRQPLLQGGGLEANQAPITVEQLQRDQSCWEFKTALLALVRSVEQAYWELHAARVNRDILGKQKPLIEEVVRIETANLGADRAVGADVAKAKTQLHRIRQRMIEANRVVREKELQLGGLLGVEPHCHVALVPISAPLSAPLVPDRCSSISRTINYQPQLIQQRIQTRILQLELLLAQNQYLPRFELVALYRANGLEDDLGSSLEMMLEHDFYDWQFGAAFSVPLGRRASGARWRAAELELARENAKLRESVRLAVFEVDETITRIEAFYTEYQAAKDREEQANEWLRGARLRYENPPPTGRSENWLLAALDDLLFALQASADAANEAAQLLAEYNTELARLQEIEGTLLIGSGVSLQNDPCSAELVEQLPQIELPVATEALPPDGSPEDSKERKDDEELIAPESEEPPSQTTAVPALPRLGAEEEETTKDGLRRLPPVAPTVRITGIRPLYAANGGETSPNQLQRLPVVEYLHDMIPKSVGSTSQMVTNRFFDSSAKTPQQDVASRPDGASSEEASPR